MKTNIRSNSLFRNHFRTRPRRSRWPGLALGLGLALSAHALPIITTQPTNQTVSLNATARFTVGATTDDVANFPLSYQWQHNGTNLLGATSSTLRITNVTQLDAGDYQAIVSDAQPSSTPSDTAVLEVDPTFFKIMTGVIVTDVEGSANGTCADYDNDGYPDLFVANIGNGTTRNTLYHNIGGTNFTRYAMSPLTTDFMRAGLGVWADYNNDGNVDLIVANLEGGLNAQRLYRNNGDGTFTGVVDAGLRSDTTRATAPTWIDYNNDGFLDLFMTKGMWDLGGVANDCLFRNNGDGAFEKMTAAQVGPMLNDQWRSWGCSSVDYDNDGRQELEVFHSPGGSLSVYTNVTWRYQADGTFVPTTPSGITDTWENRAWGDYNNDGWLDAFTWNSSGQAVLYRNLGVGGFTNVSAVLNVTNATFMNYAASWADYDNDGWLDIYYTGGGTSANGLLHNNQDGTFTEILTGSPVHDLGNRMVPCWTDYNNDGFLDLFVARGNEVPESNLLYRNNGNTNHWLKVKLDGRASNRSGIAARVRAQATINGQTISQMREISCAGAQQNGLLAHFGLGDATKVDTLRIEWPSGIVQELKDVAVDQKPHLTVVETQGAPPDTKPQVTAQSRDAAGVFHATVAYPTANLRCVLEASTNLVQWTKVEVRTNAPPVAMEFTDVHATNQPVRFYRVVVP